MENNIMIKASGVSKEYRLGAIGGTTLREDLQRLGAKIRKRKTRRSGSDRSRSKMPEKSSSP